MNEPEHLTISPEASSTTDVISRLYEKIAPLYYFELYNPRFKHHYITCLAFHPLTLNEAEGDYRYICTSCLRITFLLNNNHRTKKKKTTLHFQSSGMSSEHFKDWFLHYFVKDNTKASKESLKI